MADQVSLIKGIGSAIGKGLGVLPKFKEIKSKDKTKSAPQVNKPKPSKSVKPAPRSKSAGPKKRDATFKDAAAAVSSGNITPLDAIQISPTYAKKYATKVEDARGDY